MAGQDAVAGQGAVTMTSRAADAEPWWESDPRFDGRFQSVDDGSGD